MKVQKLSYGSGFWETNFKNKKLIKTKKRFLSPEAGQIYDREIFKNKIINLYR